MHKFSEIAMVRLREAITIYVLEFEVTYSKNNKSTGLNGSRNDICKTFGPKIDDFLLDPKKFK